MTNNISEIMTRPYQNTATAKLITERMRDLSHRKTQAEIASNGGFANANMMTFLKNGRNKAPLDRMPSLAKALEVDPAFLMRLALDPGGLRNGGEGDHRHLRHARDREQAWLADRAARRIRQFRPTADGTVAISAAGHLRKMSSKDQEGVFTIPMAPVGPWDPLSMNEKAWIEFIRVISCGSDPKVTPTRVHALRMPLDTG